MSFHRMGCRTFCSRVSLSVVAPLGEPGVSLQGTVRDSGRWAPEMGHLCLR